MAQNTTLCAFGSLITALTMAVAVLGEAEVSTEGLLALWLCDEDKGHVVHDSSGNGNDAVFVDSEGTPDWVKGKFGASVRFTQTGWCETAAPVVVDTKGFTMGCWVFPFASQKAFTNIMSSHQEPPQRGISFERSEDALNAFGVAIGADGWMGCGAATKFLLNMSDWNHMVVVREDDGKLAQGYLNGRHRAKDEACGNDANVVAATSNFRLGNWVLGGREFNGIVDEAFVFNRALSEDEVMSLHDEGWPPGDLSVSHNSKLVTAWADIKGRQQ